MHILYTVRYSPVQRNFILTACQLREIEVTSFYLHVHTDIQGIEICNLLALGQKNGKSCKKNFIFVIENFHLCTIFFLLRWHFNEQCDHHAHCCQYKRNFLKKILHSLLLAMFQQIVYGSCTTIKLLLTPLVEVW